ncbi:MAG: GPP34 family phosphoprotein [Leptolyngbya sp. PLA3]|nr:MAG: GPP34 family phosphoprotein [Cyanobacteria bacterium CYA]MCE7968034.1 GPP34 family phosphoprotein [Leptolyngbya sp. PL-A3]
MYTASMSLPIYQEILLLALRDRRGTPMGSWTVQAIAGGVSGDLVLGGRVALEGRRSLVTLIDAEPMHDPVLDGCLLQVAQAKRRASVQTWISRFANQKLYHASATELCERGVLRESSERVMLLFSRTVYPEVDPRPERAIIERLRKAIFSDDATIDARTSVLIALASATDLLGAVFPRKELRARRKRIEAIRDGQAVGKAAKAAIDGIQAAIIVACIVPAIMTT